MTLNITVLTPAQIFQSADYRLFDEATGKPTPMPSTKAVIVTGLAWTGFITYTGVGRVGTKDTSEFVREWLSATGPTSFESAVETLRVAASTWFRRNARLRRRPQTFVVAGYVDGLATAAVVSNFERWHGAEQGEVAAEFFVSTLVARHRAEVIVTGQRPTVPRERREYLARLAGEHGVDPARVRRALAAATSDAAKLRPGVISEDSFVYSHGPDGRDHEEVFGRSRTTLVHAVPDGARQSIEALLDEQFGPGQWSMAGATFARSGPPTAPSWPCRPRRGDADLDTSYTLIELDGPEGRRSMPRAVNVAGLVVGEGAPAWQGPSYPCIWPEHDNLVFLRHLGGLGGQARAANDAGWVVGWSETPERASTACLWRDHGELEDLGSSLGRHSAATSINAAGDIGGWVSIHTVDGGQQHFRPACWPKAGDAVVLRELDGGWGEVVDIDEEGVMLVRIHDGIGAEAGLWDGGRLSRLGLPDPRTRAVYPRRRTRDGTTVGTAIGQDHTRRIVSCDSSGEWSVLAAWNRGGELMAADSHGNLVGWENVDRYEVPWLWRRGETASSRLPHYRFHHHRPHLINDQGWIVGAASADNCSHPLLWVPSDVAGC